MGPNALNQSALSTSSWNAGDYATVGGFVARLGAAALDLLDPQQGERVLDVGCGDGVLSRQLAERGATVVGVDSSPEMIAAARTAGLDARLIDAADMDFDAEFDAAFSNAALHWMLKRERVAARVFQALCPGGRFAGEMGGEGNIARLSEALDTELILRGYVPPSDSRNWYPSVDAFAAVYEAAGFEQVDARLIERPTRLDHGVAAWVTTFRAGWLERAGVPEAEFAAIGKAVAASLGECQADYVRLRFLMRKPH